MGQRLALQIDTNFYAAGIDVVVRPCCRFSLIGLGFLRFRVRVFEIFDTQDYCQGGICSEITRLEPLKFSILGVRKMTFKFKPLAAVFLLAIAAAQANAANVTLDGGNFTISYDTAVVGLFGTPELVGSTLVFAPGGAPGFAAQSDSGVKFTNSTFSFMITADPGYKLSSFNLFEGGDYYLIGDSSRVSVGGQLRVKPVGEAVMTAAIAPSMPLTTHTSFEQFATTDWDATASINPTMALSSAVVSIENLLGARARLVEDGYAFIQKKNVELGFVLTPIPEPASYAMLLAGLGMLGLVARRRSRR